VIVTLVMVELLLTAIDRLWLSSSPHVPIGGPYWEVRTREGDWSFQKRAHPGSPLGFRTADPYALQPEVPRLLFLGDSYTEGSGRAPECNYPEVVQAELSRRLGRPVEVMNAGVSGYGPLDALHLLDLLVERGYAFDGIVHNLFLENDFTDNLPATTRRVAAGMAFRFPESPWLRWLHPLDSRLFHHLLFIVRVRETGRVADYRVERGRGLCQPDERFSRPPPPGRRERVRERLAVNYGRTGARAATGVVSAAIDGIAARARALDVPLVLVVFPDRALADAALQAALELEASDPRYELDRLRRFVAEHFAGLPRIDLTETLARGRGVYRHGDTHLSDRGNLRAGEAVARALAERLPALGIPALAPPGYGPAAAAPSPPVGGPR